MQSPQDIRIEGIRQTNARTWAVVGSRPTGHDGNRILIGMQEFAGVGAKALAIKAAGTNRIVTTALNTLLGVSR